MIDEAEAHSNKYQQQKQISETLKQNQEKLLSEYAELKQSMKADNDILNEKNKQIEILRSN